MSRRRIVMFNRVTPEGHFAAADGDQDWFVPDSDIDGQGAESISGTGMFLFGRHTYAMFASFWPHALAESAANPQAGGPLTPQQRAMAVALNELPKLVFSRTPFYPAALAELEQRRGNQQAARDHLTEALRLARNPAERTLLKARLSRLKGLP